MSWMSELDVIRQRAIELGDIPGSTGEVEVEVYDWHAPNDCPNCAGTGTTYEDPGDGEGRCDMPVPCDCPCHY